MAAAGRMMTQYEAPRSDCDGNRWRFDHCRGAAIPRKALARLPAHLRTDVEKPEPKFREGDARTPQGAYIIDNRNPHSGFYRALHISYPNMMSVAAACAHGANAGSDVMIHGIKNGMGWLGVARKVTPRGGPDREMYRRHKSEMDEIWRVVSNGTSIVIKQ